MYKSEQAYDGETHHIFYSLRLAQKLGLRQAIALLTSFFAFDLHQAATTFMHCLDNAQ